MYSSSQKLVLITGASRGLGYALSQECVARGAYILPLVRREEDASLLLRKFSPSCRPILVDLRSNSLEEEIVEALEDVARPLDAFVSNAGIGGRAVGLSGCDAGQLRDLFELHCVSSLRCCRAALPWLLQAQAAKIIGISSQYGSIENTLAGVLANDKSSYAYRISKASLNMLMACIANEFAGSTISSVAFDPGTFKSALGPADAVASANEAGCRVADVIFRD